MIARQKNFRISSHTEFTAPCVKESMLPIQSITLNTDVLEVLTLFQTLPDLPALPVLDDEQKFFGLVSRRSFLNLMARAYARELFANKPLVSLLKIDETIFQAPLVVHAEDRIDQVMLDYLLQDPNLSYEALPVLGNEGVLGVIKVADMMAKMTQSQGALIDTMEQLSVRLKAEVASAAVLQRNLLRPERIDLPGLRGLSTLIPSSEVGGDFYDYYVVGDRWVVMLVGDVSGHGVAAGTMVSAAKAGVNLLESDKEKEPHKILSRLSDTILKTAHQSLLMTMFAVCLDTQTGELRYANAGHQFPYIYRSITGTLSTLELGGLPLGNQANVEYEQGMTEMDVGDCLFLYTDGIVEEEDAKGECFGYERLEEILAIHAESTPEVLRDTLLESLSAHVGRKTFDDDVTIFFVEHHQRRKKRHDAVESSDAHDFELVRIVDSFYRSNGDSISPRIARQNLAFLAESNFSDLIPSLSKQGIRRVLMRHHPISRQLGWNTLLSQHQYHTGDDLGVYLPNPRQLWEFDFRHSDDKAFIIEEVEAWLNGMVLPDSDRVDAVILLLDELIENGLYAAPRDGKNSPLFAKGTVRQLEEDEVLSLKLSIQDDILGISLTDSWGTLTPSIFLNRLSCHLQGQGLESGTGGAGLYFIWRMSDYLQLRVLPHHETQISAFLDLKNAFDPETDTGFQFLYHTEIEETFIHEQFQISNLS